MAKTLLVATASAILALGAASVVADENKFLDIEPLSSNELSAETGDSVDGGSQAATDDPLRKRGPSVRNSVGSGQSTVSLNSGQTSQINSSALSATNDMVSISNIARGGS